MSAPQATSVTFEDFSGGITDNFVSNAITKSALLENFAVTDNAKLRTRMGSAILDEFENELDTGDRVSGLYNFSRDSQLVLVSNTSLYVQEDDGALFELLGPDGNVAFSAGSASTLPAYAEWKGHVFLTNDAGSKVIKAYQDENDDWQVRTAGLPEMADNANYVDATVLAQMIALANSMRTTMLQHYESGLAAVMAAANAIKAAYNLHRVDVSNHTAGADNAHPITSPNATDLASLFVLTNELVLDYNLHVTDALLGAGWLYHSAQSILSSTVPGITTIGELVDPPSTLTAAAEGLLIVRRYYDAHDGDPTTHGGVVASHQTGLGDHYITGHAAKDTVAYDILLAAPVATDFASLKVLIQAMVTAYGDHYQDSKQSVPTYHRVLTGLYFDSGGDFSGSQLSITTVPDTSYPDMVALLNELRIRYNTHQTYAAVHTFYANIDEVTTAAIINVDSGPYLRFDPNPLYTLANKIKTEYNEHVAREGAASAFPHNDVTPTQITNMQVPATDPYYSVSTVATTPRTLAACVFNLRLYIQTHMESIGGANFHDAADTGNNFDPAWNNGLRYLVDAWGGVVPDDFTNAVLWLNTVRTHYNTHQANKVPHQNDSAFTNLDPVGTADLSLADYIYGFHYVHTYTVGSVERVTVGPVLRKQYTNVIAVETQPAVLGGLGALANDVGDNYATSEIKIWIFRTTNGGSVLYKVGEIANGVTTFTDSITDDILTENEPVYTEGNLPDHTQPPLSKYLAVSGDIGFYLNITEGGESLPNRLRQSLPSILDACPGDFFVDLDEPGTGVASTKGRVVAFSEKGVYRVDGTFDETGNGAMVLDRIYDADGLASHLSIVQIETGLLFAGLYGFYFTDGYQVTKLSKEFNLRYAALVNKSGIVGAYNKVEQTIHWAVQEDESSSDNDTIYTLHLNHGPKNCFSTWAGGTSFSPSSLAVFNDQLIRGDSRAYLFKHDRAYLTDPLVDATLDPADFFTQAILYDWKSVFTNCGIDDTRKWGTRITVKADQETNLAIQPISNTDMGKSSRNLKPIIFHSTWTWGDPLIEWGDEELLWDYELGVIEAWRRFPAGALRFGHRQIELTNAHVALWNSDATEPGTVAAATGTLKTLTLATPATFMWPDDPIGYVLAFDDDGFVTEYEITERTSDGVLTFDDPDGTSPTPGSVQWVLRGKPKGETLSIISLQMEWAPQSKSFTPFLGGSQGENT